MSAKIDKQIAEIHAVVVRGAPAAEALTQAARAVVEARYYMGEDGWDRLKNAIGALEDLVGRAPKTQPSRTERTNPWAAH